MFNFVKFILVWKIIQIMMGFQHPLARKQIGGGDVRWAGVQTRRLVLKHPSEAEPSTWSTNITRLYRQPTKKKHGGDHKYTQSAWTFLLVVEKVLSSVALSDNP